MIIQTDEEIMVTPPALGDKAALQMCAEIAAAFGRAKQAALTEKPASTSRNIVDRLRNTGRETGALIILSGLDETQDNFRQHLHTLHVEKQIAVVCIEDVLEYQAIAPGNYQFKSGNKKKQVTLEEKQTNEIHQRLLRASDLSLIHI